MYKKIGFTGSHSVGKTTLLYQVAGELQKLGFNVALVNETARETRYPINDRTTKDAQIDIMALQIHNELDVATRTVDVILTDRTALDAVAYTYLAEEEKRIKEGTADAMLPLATYFLKSYDLIFYVKPFDGDFISDRERWCSETAQRKVDRILESLYIDNSCPITVLGNSLPLAERKAYVTDIMQQLLG